MLTLKDDMPSFLIFMLQENVLLLRDVTQIGVSEIGEKSTKSAC